jgi:hypothetical protein
MNSMRLCGFAPLSVCPSIRALGMAVLLGGPAQALGQAQGSAPENSMIRFTVTKGQSVKVCKAYANRLNQTTFSLPPYCDRPQQGHDKEFEALERQNLTPTEVAAVKRSIENFLITGGRPPSSTSRPVPPSTAPTAEEVDAILREASASLAMGELIALRIRPKPDLDNDGRPDEVLVWRGGRCGETIGEATAPSRGWSYVLVTNASGTAVDWEKTVRIFGHPLGGYKVSYYDIDKHKRVTTVADKFRPVGTQLGVFSFQGQWYFDTFSETEWGDFQGQRRGSPDLARTLGVFIHQSGKTRQVCELRQD